MKMSRWDESPEELKRREEAGIDGDLDWHWLVKLRRGYMTAPDLDAIAEIDYLRWHLEEMLRAERARSVLDQAIDSATGFDKEKMREAKGIMRRIRTLQRQVTGHEAG